MNEYITFSLCSCAPPACPEIEIYYTIEGGQMVMVSDDQQHCCTMEIEEFRILATKFLDLEI